MILITNKEDIKKALEDNNFKLFGIGGYPSTRSEIWPLVNDYEVICGNPSGELDAIKQRTKVSVFLQTENNKIPEKKPQVILSDKSVVEHINSSGKNKKVALYFYKPTEKVAEICKKNNWIMIANKPELFEKYSSKLAFYKILEDLKINRDIKIFDLEKLDENLDSLFEMWGEKIVIQFVDEGGGRGTFFFKKEERNKIMDRIAERFELIDKEKSAGMKIVASRFVKGPVLSITGCITKDNGILTSYCQYQMIDIPETIKNKKDAVGVFCGHDWSLSKNIPDKINKKGIELITKIGEELKKGGMLGIFGLDLIWDKEKEDLIPLEINVRLLGTYPTTVYVQLDKGEVPLVAFHLLDFLGIEYKIKSEEVFRKDKVRNGAHLLLFNPTGFDAKCGKEVKGGVYKIVDGKMEWVRLGVELADIQNKGEFILTEGVPIKTLVYKRNGKLLKVLAKEELSANDAKELNLWAKEIVEVIYKELNLQPNEK